MSSQPELKPSDLIEITGSHPIPAIVTSDAFEDAYEVVYLDETGKAVAEEVQWVDGVWQFLHLTPRRIDAETLERFRPFVKLLRETPQTQAAYLVPSRLCRPHFLRSRGTTVL